MSRKIRYPSALLLAYQERVGVLNEQAPGNGFGDYFEKIEHRVGTHLLAEALKNKKDVDAVSVYESVGGETIDVVAYTNEGDIGYAGEVETSSNNSSAVVDDYNKLAELGGERFG
ncbi:hypothetical protein ACODNH_01855 (plasmid) [Haloarcula sp. NS06]|uniref:hypothetical protein n=1 Tax=Haloarcula sp. NS06 TaxID=3409688 RepID=UPI003DA6F0A4